MTSESADPDTAPGREPGVLAAVRRLSASIIGIIHTRLELLSTEIEEESLRVRRLFNYWLLSVFFLGIGALLLTGFVIVLFWDDYRLVALGVGAFIYLVLGAVIGWFVRGGWRSKPKIFSASLEELRKDARRLTPRS